MVEIIFDGVYLVLAAGIGAALLFSGEAGSARQLAGVMALVLAGGDAFHLLPRMALIKTGREEALRAALGWGKFITSLTMTVFYLLLWQIAAICFGPAGAGMNALVWALAAVRAALCLLPQNRWTDALPPVSWGVWRNLPFLALGVVVAARFFLFRSAGLGSMWMAIAVSFACYLPVVLWANKNPKIGMLMLPKTCAYLWMLVLCLSL